MIKITEIDFSKLKAYDGKVSRSFELICYRIAHIKYGEKGTFTPIDGSGGDGGVEFYLELENGEVWGWQCKFFGDTGRLNIGSRKNAIKDSLNTAIKKYNILTKWFLCLKTDLTEGNTSGRGNSKKGERDWFKNELTKQIPEGREIELVHWGESEFINFLSDSKFNGIRSFFFGSLEFNQDWFKDRFYENFEKVKDKYDPELHTIDKYTQSKIDCLTCDKNYTKFTDELKQELNQKILEIKSVIKDFKNHPVSDKQEKVIKDGFIDSCNEFEKHYKIVFDKIEFIESCFINNTLELLSELDLDELRNDFNSHFDPIENYDFEKYSLLRKYASDILYLIPDFGDLYQKFFRNYFHKNHPQIHFIGDAAKGKTHIACDISYKKITKHEPVIFFTGDKFTNEPNLFDAIRKLLDIPAEYSLDDFLLALDEYALIHNVRIPIIIDGLNETTFNRIFSPLWKDHLAGFISKVLKTKNIVVITTCRTTYANRIWDNISDRRFHSLRGFEDIETIHDAIKKYFNKHKLIGDIHFAQVQKFRDPIFLRIFCETKNPNWEYSDWVVVNIEAETTYGVFSEYLSQVNARVTRAHPHLRIDEPFIQSSTKKIASYLWEENLRELPIDKFIRLIDGEIHYEKDKSKAEILINEGLIISRDIRDLTEYVSFTYDVLVGFLIGEYLLQQHNDPTFFLSDEFINKIFGNNGKHPLFEDIISALCKLFPHLKNTSLHKIIVDADQFSSDENKYFNYVFGKSVLSLFELPAHLIKESDVETVESLFRRNDENKKLFFDFLIKTISDINHPFNAEFLSDLLKSQYMSDRDLTWTEYIRKNGYELETFISDFEKEGHSIDSGNLNLAKKQFLAAKFVTWLLTSTNLTLRDKATRALYYFGRKFPIEFASLVYESLGFNDPYVWERTLAALYGVVMAKHNEIEANDFRTQVLPELSRTIYELMFTEDAPYSTTHILARDYARRIIEIGLIHHPGLLTLLEIEKIRPPYTIGGIRDIGEFDYGEKEWGYGGPIRMDFSNYTLGRIVKHGHGYDNPPEKIRVRRQIYWRIFSLGWNEEKFKDAETALGRENYGVGRRFSRSDVERYGKKYSWVAYYEIAGLRDDKGLLDNKYGEFRVITPDIDPSFPVKQHNEKFDMINILGDKNQPLQKWYKSAAIPSLESYLRPTCLNGHNGDWVCLDSAISQENIEDARSSYIFVRGIIVREKDFEEIFRLLGSQDVGEDWLPEIINNHNTFAGEMNCFKEATEKNEKNLKLTVLKKFRKIKRGEPGFVEPVRLIILGGEDQLPIVHNLPNEMEKDDSVYSKFKVRIPVMEYNWDISRSSVNSATNVKMVAKEIAWKLKLKNEAQSFDLIDSEGNLASQTIEYSEDFNNNHNFVYIRKDLLDHYLKVTKQRLIWVIWGRREVQFELDEELEEFTKKYKINGPIPFQKIVAFE